jgi:hypothetical protein
MGRAKKRCVRRMRAREREREREGEADRATQSHTEPQTSRRERGLTQNPQPCLAT